jgi:hypothetical protein
MALLPRIIILALMPQDGAPGTYFAGNDPAAKKIAMEPAMG